MYLCIDVSMYLCIYVCMYVCMYVLVRFEMQSLGSLNLHKSFLIIPQEEFCFLHLQKRDQTPSDVSVLSLTKNFDAIVVQTNPKANHTACASMCAALRQA